MNWIHFALSQAGNQGNASNPAALFLPIIGMIVIFYLLLIRPQQKRQKELQRMIDSLRKGDRVMTSGGIYGTVVGMRDNIVVLRIAENVKIEIAKSAISNLVQKGD
jgi:preprotein translocase subunit YajC